LTALVLEGTQQRTLQAVSKNDQITVVAGHHS
jgi:hypothetical protein